MNLKTFLLLLVLILNMTFNAKAHEGKVVKSKSESDLSSLPLSFLNIQTMYEHHMKTKCSVQGESDSETSTYVFGETHTSVPTKQWRGKILTTMINCAFSSGKNVVISAESLSERKIEEIEQSIENKRRYLESSLSIFLSKSELTCKIKLQSWESLNHQLQKRGFLEDFKNLQKKSELFLEELQKKERNTCSKEEWVKLQTIYKEFEEEKSRINYTITNFAGKEEEQRNINICEYIKKSAKDKSTVTIVIAGGDHVNFKNAALSQSLPIKGMKVVIPKPYLFNEASVRKDDSELSGLWFYIKKVDAQLIQIQTILSSLKK